MFLVFLLVGYFIVWFILHLTYCPYPSTYCLYFSEPGGGKTTILTRILLKYSKPKYGKVCYSNYPVKIPNVFRFDKSHMGYKEFGPHSLLVFDEGSLNGFDNRNFKTNFKDPKLLSFMKKIRHHQTSICFGNQGWEELDSKIRTLTTQYWLVRRLPLFSLAIRVKKRVGCSEKEDDIRDMYKMPSLFAILFRRSSFQICFRPLYYKYFDSFEKDYLPPMNRTSWLKSEKGKDVKNEK